MRITQERLKELLDYDPLSGLFTWKSPRCPRIKPGDSAGTPSNGYIGLTIGSIRTYAHRLAWLWVYGEFPHGQQIDHINGNKQDNRIENLRIASPSTNCHNKPLRKDNKTGHTGVFFNPLLSKNPWVAYISFNGHREYLGYYPTKEEAIEARQIKELTL